MAGRRKAGIPWGWLSMSGLGMAMSTFMNYQGFKVIFPDRAMAACLMAFMLEGFVIGTGVLIRRASRRSWPLLAAMALTFGGNSVMLSVAGMNAGAEQFQRRLNLPQYELEDAHKAEVAFATGAARTQVAALGRIRNEFSFFAKQNMATASAGSAGSGFARDQQERQDDLNALKAKWDALEFGTGFAGAKTPDQIFGVLRRDYATLQPLVAMTNRLTSGKPMPMPAFPAPRDHAAEDAHAGENDATGMNSLRHPTLRWIFIIPLAVMMDFGGMLTAATMRVVETGDEPAGDPEPEVIPDWIPELEDDWDERQRRMRRVGNDRLAAACDGMIHAAVEAHRVVEKGALTNLTLMRAYEIFEEEVALLRSAARIGLKPETVEAQVDEAFARLQGRLAREWQMLDGEHAKSISKRQGEQTVQAMSDQLALAKQIAGIQAEMNTLSGAGR